MTGSFEERRIWIYQSRKLLSICTFLLGEFGSSCARGQNILVAVSLALRLVVLLTDLKGWKNITDSNLQNAELAVKNLLQYIGSGESGLYISIRRYINTLDIPLSSSSTKNVVQSEDKFLITASAITLALRPLPMENIDVDSPNMSDVHYAAENYCGLILTIPLLVQRLPAVLISAMKHKSTLSPCLQTLLVIRLKDLTYIVKSSVFICDKHVYK